MAPENAITGSSEAWATLVANIAPLLVLVGERHVKGYFKIMSKPSHQLLFAAGPIGLVTAVTTLIRLKGSVTLKRLIGRLFETRAEIYADVTGASSGDVVLELKNGMLEQTTEPDENDLALFFFRGAYSGPVTGAMEYWERGRLMFMGMLHSRVMSESLQYAKSTTSVMAAALRVYGEDAEERLLDAARKSNTEPDVFTPFSECAESDVEAAVFSYASFSDISLALTANECIDAQSMEVARIASALFCLSAIAALVILNWFRQKDVLSTCLIAAGTVISATGSYFIARQVNNVTERISYDLTGFNVTRSGFLSRRIPEGVNLTFKPSTIISSVIRPKTYYEYKYGIDVISHGVIGFMVVGYIALYLGLRTTEWWICFCILVVSALASVARAVFLPNILSVITSRRDNVEDGRPDPYSEYKPYGVPGALMFRNRSGSKTNASCISEKEKKGTMEVELSPSGSASISFHDLVVTWSLSNLPNSLEGSDSNTTEKKLLRRAFLLVLGMRKEDIQPAELGISGRNVSRINVFPGKAYVLYSDWLRADGVYRLPLGLVCKSAESLSEDFLRSMLISLNTWLWRFRELASLPLDGFQQLSTFDLVPGETWRRDQGPQSYHWNDLHLSTIWMAAKICYVIMGRWSDETIRMRFHAELDDSFVLARDRDYMEKLIAGAKEVGMLVPTGDSTGENSGN